jgi:hypothetical protein
VEEAVAVVAAAFDAARVSALFYFFMMMSTENKEADMMLCCASCGIAGVDDIKLMDCDNCDLVKYCSDACNENHREQHDEECRKRQAELRDRDLFTQPDESHLGECPICCLPLPIDSSKSTLASCCSKTICRGCNYTNQKREVEAGLEKRCPFCRDPAPKTDEEIDKNVMERVKKNDPVAMRVIGRARYEEGDYESALEYYKKAAELGNVVAHFRLSEMYLLGEDVEKDTKKAVYHSEEAAIGGHAFARHNLGCVEAKNGRFERAVKHFIIAANLGNDGSLKCVKDLYAKGHASKEDYAGALRAYQAAVDATKSAERKEAESYIVLRRLEEASRRLNEQRR